STSFRSSTRFFVSAMSASIISARPAKGWTFSRFPVEKLSIIFTVSFRRSSSSTMCEPIKPPPPVTTYTDIDYLPKQQEHISFPPGHQEQRNLKLAGGL